MIGVLDWGVCIVRVEMYSAEAEESLLGGNPDFVLDAIDNIDTKASTAVVMFLITLITITIIIIVIDIIIIIIIIIIVVIIITFIIIIIIVVVVVVFIIIIIIIIVIVIVIGAHSLCRVVGLVELLRSWGSVREYLAAFRVTVKGLHYQ